jgi:hypothetical protein
VRVRGKDEVRVSRNFKFGLGLGLGRGLGFRVRDLGFRI